jgi:hypothetical protein
LAKLLYPQNEIAAVSTSPAGKVIRKSVEDICPGDYVWTFCVENYFPVLTGHFKFVEVISSPKMRTLSAAECRWFNNKDGPIVFVPENWVLISDGEIQRIKDRQSYFAFAFPGYLHDQIPLALDLELFSDSFLSSNLTENAAYFLGAFALRPQFYSFKNDVWGIFGARFNRSGEYGIGNTSRLPTLKIWYKAHLSAFRKLADATWGPSGYFIEEHGRGVGLSDKGVPAGHQPDAFQNNSTNPVGFSVHAPIARGKSLTSTGKFNDPDLRLFQYWYACLENHLVERCSRSVQTAFLLGAFDTVSNADKDRKSIGLDWPDGFSGEYPMYSIVHTIGRVILETFDGQSTQNPRAAAGRLRGRIPRCRIWEQMRKIGFISDLRAVRARDYEPDISTIKPPSMPYQNALSVILGVDVSTIEYPSGRGTSEFDLTKQKLFKIGNLKKHKFVELETKEENVFAACSLPFGSNSKVQFTSVGSAASKKVALSKSGWEVDALERIANVNTHLPPLKVTIPKNDMIFEFLIASLVSKLEGCSEAWVVPRSEDQGVDVGAKFLMGSELGAVDAIFQAKLQASSVGRRIVDMLRGSLHREEAIIGYVVTNNLFSVPAQRSAKNDYPEIRLIDGKTLCHQLLEREVGLFSRGSGVRKKIYIDLTYFERLRDLAVQARGKAGKIRITFDADSYPILSI